MEALQTITETITKLTAENSLHEKNAEETNVKIRALYGKIVDLERDIASLARIRDDGDFPTTHYDLLQSIEAKIKDVEPEVAYKGRADGFESILKFVQNSLRVMIAKEVASRQATDRVECQVKLASDVVSQGVKSVASSSCDTSSKFTNDVVIEGNPQLRQIFEAVIEKQRISKEFVDELLSFKGVYLTGSVVLKTLLNQNYDDARYWLDVVVLSGNQRKISDKIAANDYVCVEESKNIVTAWTRKTYRKKGSATIDIDIKVYFYEPIRMEYFTEVNFLTKALWILPYKFMYNFYDGINFFVLDKKALRTKTHSGVKPPLWYPTKYEKAGFKFEVIEKEQEFSHTKKIHHDSTIDDLKKRYRRKNPWW